MARLRTLGSRLQPAKQSVAPAPVKRADPFYFTKEWKELRAQAIERDGGVCVVPGCGRPVKVVDHKLARRLGGPDTLENLRCLCASHDAGFREDHLGNRRGGG